MLGAARGEVRELYRTEEGLDMMVEVLPVLADRRCLQTVRLGLGNPLLTCFGNGDTRAGRGMQALLHLDHRPRQPSGRLFLRLESLDMPLRLTVWSRRGVLGDPGALLARLVRPRPLAHLGHWPV